MNLFRIVHDDYSSFYDAYSGVGASINGGRWNKTGTSTVYVSTTIKTAVAEKAYYSIFNKLYIYKNKSTLTSYEKSEILNVPFILVEADFCTNQAIVNNFTIAQKLSSELKKASLPDKTPKESTLSPWQKLTNQWTSGLGHFISATAKDEGCHVFSARQNNGRNYAFYVDHYLFTNIKNFTKNRITLSAANIKCSSKWNGKGQYSLDHIFYESKALGITGVVKIQNRI